MRVVRPAWRVRGAIALAFIVSVGISGCSLINRSSDANAPGDAPVSTNQHGACWFTYGDDVVAMAANGQGQVLFISGAQPANWPDNQDWLRTDLALNVLDLSTSRSRYIASSWKPQDEIPRFGTPRPGTVEPPAGHGLTETMQDVDVARTGTTFVVGVAMEAYRGLGKLYSGEIPAEGSDIPVLEPGAGLTKVPINRIEDLESIRTFRLSDDGTKVAAIVGRVGELRVYDLATNELSVYSQGPNGSAVVSHDFPGNDPDRTPMVATVGSIQIHWSPDATRIALSRAESSGNASLSVFTVATGELHHVASFEGSSAPQVAWSSDGASLYVLYTPRDSAGGYLDSQFERLEAAQDGKRLGFSPMQRPDYFRSEPANLENDGSDEHFVFTWENALYRIDTPGGDPEGQFQQITPDSLQIAYRRPYADAKNDRAVFLASDTSGQHVTARTFFTAEQCPSASSQQEGGAR